MSMNFTTAQLKFNIDVPVGLTVLVWDVLWHFHLQRFHMEDLDAAIHPVGGQHLTGQLIHRL